MGLGSGGGSAFQEENFCEGERSKELHVSRGFRKTSSTGKMKKTGERSLHI